MYFIFLAVFFSRSAVVMNLPANAGDSGFDPWLRKLKQGLCINLEGWDGEGDGREVQKGGDICISSVQSLSRVRLFATP